jgi:hypothetical protein
MLGYRRLIGSGLVILAGAVVVTVFTLGAHSQTDQLEKALRDQMTFVQGMRDFAWADEHGRPAGLPEEDWVPVTKELGLIWQRVDGGPDLALWVVLTNGTWRAARIVDPGDAYPYREG